MIYSTIGIGALACKITSYYWVEDQPLIAKVEFTSPCLIAFASLGLLPTKEQFTWLKSLFTNAKIHTVFDGGISGRVADCKVATWQLRKNARFSLDGDHGEFYYNKKKYRIPVNIFSLSRFERLSGIHAGTRTHKPKAPFETFYQSFTNTG